MGVRRWFGLFSQKADAIEPLKERMIRLEAELVLLGKLIQEEKVLHEKIVIEELNVEKIIVEKLEYQNNFGALGIRELKGRLNIGANYGVGVQSPFVEEIKKSLDSDRKPKVEDKGEAPISKERVGPRVSYHKKDL